MKEKIVIVSFIGLFIGLLNLIIGVSLRNPYMVFGGYGACIIFPVIVIIEIMLEDM